MRHGHFRQMTAKRLARFRSDRQGSVLILVAISAVVLVLMAGIGLDVSRIFLARSKVRAAEDAATLRAVETMRTLVGQGQTLDQAKPSAIKAGNASFYAQLGGAADVLAGAPKLDINYDGNTGMLLATIQAPVLVQNAFMKLAGIADTDFAVTTSANVGLKRYIHLIFLLDTSQSMGILASEAGISQEQNDPNMQCAFACHDSKPYYYGYSFQHVWNAYPGQTPIGNYWLYLRCFGHGGIASQPPQLRIDALKAAVKQVIGQAEQSSNSYTATTMIYGTPTYPTVIDSNTDQTTDTCPDQLGHVSYYTYQKSAPEQSQLQGQALPTAMSLVDRIDIEDNTWIIDNLQNQPPGNGPFDYLSGTTLIGLSQTDNVLGWLANNLPSQGNGFSASSPLQVIVLVTDGTQTQNWPAGQYVQDMPVSAQACDAVKQKAQIMSLYTTYYDLSNAPENYIWTERVQPIKDQIGPALQACATSSSMFAEASDGPQISQALSQLFMNFDNSLYVSLTQ